jgi:hypothetical protein
MIHAHVLGARLCIGIVLVVLVRLSILVSCRVTNALRVTRLLESTQFQFSDFFLLVLCPKSRMSLRRFAQANHAANTPGSPHSPSPRLNGVTHTPVTPRARVSYVHSPSSTPSISSSTPFDWDAARSRRPPPYASPLSAKRKSRMSTIPDGVRPLPKKVVKKKGIFERSVIVSSVCVQSIDELSMRSPFYRITALPSQIVFEISMFPHNLPMPAPRTTGWLIGSSMHLLHLCLRISQIRATADSDIGWEDLYWERSQQSWFDWVSSARH